MKLSYRRWKLLSKWFAKHRRRLPDTRLGKTIKTTISDKNIYVITGVFEDGRLGEIFIRIGKEGEELRVYDLLSIAVSIGLQHGVPLETFIKKFKHQRMKPSGITNNPDIQIVSSIADFVFRWLEREYLSDE